MSEEVEDAHAAQIPSWNLERTGRHRIRRTFRLGSFRRAIEFVDTVALVAEEQGHHPNIEIRYDTVAVELYTHSIGGLHENDFIMAAKIQDLWQHLWQHSAGV